MPQILALSREFPSRYGAPIVRAIDADIFDLSYFAECMACTFCDDACCARGCDAALADVERLHGAHAADLEARCGIARTAWFAEEVKRDADFSAGLYRSSQVAGGHCVLHVAGGRGCHVHALALEKGLDYHDLKPMLCWLFPLLVEAGTLSPQPSAVDASLVCAGPGATLYAQQRDELHYLFGAELVRELDALQAARREPAA